jgi:hypothetical protein
MQETQRRLTGTLTLEGELKEIDDSMALVVWIEDDTLTQGNTSQDGDERNKYAKSYHVPLKTMELPQGRDLDYIRRHLANPDYSCPVRMIIEPDLTSRVRVLEPVPKPEANWSDFLAGLPKDQDEDWFEEQCRARQS